MHVRVERDAVDLPIDRRRLAALPGQPPADRPLVCLDTETTGLATAAGTVAFLIGLGWWAGDTFRQVQLLLPDQGEEGVLLDEVGRHIPRDAWLVTYNGRGFDWPLLVTRYRMARRAAPAHAGHLDLLPIVRRLFRHRMDDARLGTVERMLLGVVRHDDVDGWEIPGRYLGFLRGGPAQPLAAVVRHNDEDVRSLAPAAGPHRAAVSATRWRGTRRPAATSPGLARAFRRERRFEEAVDCLDAALAADPAPPTRRPGPPARGHAPRSIEEPWWSPRRRADFGGRPETDGRPASAGIAGRPSAGHGTRSASPSTERTCCGAWAGSTRRSRRGMPSPADPGRTAVVAAIEAAKLREHRLGDAVGRDGDRRARPRPRRPAPRASAAGAGARSRPAAPTLAARRPRPRVAA